MRATVVALLAVLPACATTSAGAPSLTAGPSPVVATFGDRSIRLAEVDAKAADELAKLQAQIYELRVETAERMAIEVLVADAAKRAGKTDDEWLSAKLAEGARDPSEADLERLYGQVRGRLPASVTYDDVRPQLVQAVSRELKAKRASEVFAELKQAAKFTLELPAPPVQRKSVEAIGPTKGELKAPITIVEFSDFQCPYCARAVTTLDRVVAAYPGKIRVVFRHFPLSFHEKAPKAAEAAACADEQGKFWALHDALFESQQLDVDALKDQAQRAGLDAKAFDACLDSGRMAALVERDMLAGQKVGVTGTPAFFINGRMLSGAQPEDAFRKIIDQELKGAK
jgi:protein-disulfide isomerase